MGGATALISRLNRRLAFSNERLREEVNWRQQATEDLSASNERFRAVMEALDVVVYVSDLNTYELLFINRDLCEVWGEVVGNVCWKVLQSGQTGPCSFCNNHTLIDRNGNPTGMHIWEFQSTVNKRCRECRDQAIRWTDGRLVRLEIATDVTERLRAEKELQESEEYLRTIMETIHTGVMISERDSGEIVGLNPFAAELIGADSAEVTGRPWTVYLKEMPRDGSAGNGSGRIEDGWLKTAKGEVLSVRVSRAQASIKSQQYTIHSFTDISDLRELFPNSPLTPTWPRACCRS